MFRGILLSLLTLGGVAFLIGSATFAPFSDTGDAEGDVTAGTLTVALNGENPGEIEFNVDDYCDNMAPGDECEAVITVTNTGTLVGNIPAFNIYVWIEGPDEQEGNCRFQPEDPYYEVPYHWQVAVVEVTDGDNEINGDAERLLPAPNDSTLITIVVSLNDVQENVNDCQGLTGTVHVRVVLEQAFDPHSDNDELQ